MTAKKSRAKSLTERFNLHFGHKYEEMEKEIEKEEDDLVENDEETKDSEETEKNEDGSINDVGDAPKEVADVIDTLISTDFSENPEAMVDSLEILADSEDPQAQAFIQAVDQAISSMELQNNEDQDAEYLYVFQPEKFKAMGEAKKKKAVKKAKKK